MQRFVGKVAFVTGAASGIGLATMTRLGREGAKIFAADINAGQLAEEVAKLSEEGVDIHSRALDVTDEADCRAAVEQCVTQFGKLDVLCNIAGMVLTSSHDGEHPLGVCALPGRYAALAGSGREYCQYFIRGGFAGAAL